MSADLLYPYLTKKRTLCWNWCSRKRICEYMHLQQGRFGVVLEERMRIFTDHTTRDEFGTERYRNRKYRYGKFLKVGTGTELPGTVKY
ncbi:hypothetical protein Hdeb2414_s0018g00520071 [Helianthus debilis subsp. tardiflorus]